MVEAQAHRACLANRLEATAWGRFFIMIGGLLLLPSTAVPHGIWLVGSGLIMLGLNVARRLNGMRTSPFRFRIGLGMVAGVADFAGLGLPVLPLILILIGAEIIVKAARDEKRQDGPGEGRERSRPISTD